jgi:predicted MFS family arabinose efflux permease
MPVRAGAKVAPFPEELSWPFFRPTRLFGLTIVLVSPFRAWMVDRHGPRRALPPMAAAFAAILIAIAVIPSRSGVNDAVIAVLVAAAGASAPPLGVVMRTVWSALIDDRNLLQAAYSLDGVAEELQNS